MTFILPFFILVALAYACLMLFIIRSWNSQPEFKYIVDKEQLEAIFSIIIAARNEEESIENCVRSIISCNSFNFICKELIVVDDFSEDKTLQVLKSMDLSSLKVIAMSDHLEDPDKGGKKESLDLALSQASGQYIIQLDADVTVAPDYLECVYAFVKKMNPGFVAAPVAFSSSGNVFEHFQSLDIAGMMAVTQAGINTDKWYMANGANMIYRSGVVNFSDRSFASGDDMFAIEKARQKNENIYFLKARSSIVTTPAISTIGGFFRQRLRWATKNKYNKNFWMLLMMGISLLNALCVPGYLVLLFFFSGNWIVPLACFHLLLSLSLDFILLDNLRNFFTLEKQMKFFAPSKLYHIIYISGIALASFITDSYLWKGRKRK